MRKYLLWFISFMMIGLLITPAICTAGVENQDLSERIWSLSRQVGSARKFGEIL